MNLFGDVEPDRINRPDAELLYKLYPRKVAPRDAIKKIEKALQRLREELKRECPQLPDEYAARYAWLVERVKMFAASPAGRSGTFTPHPATWFNQSRYLDDPSEWYRRNGHERANGIERGCQVLDEANRIAEERENQGYQRDAGQGVRGHGEERAGCRSDPRDFRPVNNRVH
jgi:hypothetical protein